MVIDTTLTDCFLGFSYRDVFYCENQIPEYVERKSVFIDEINRKI
jgi:hypothetical protein